MGFPSSASDHHDHKLGNGDTCEIVAHHFIGAKINGVYKTLPGTRRYASYTGLAERVGDVAQQT